MLSKDIFDAIESRYPCRTTQLTQLSALVGDNSLPSPPAFVLHGLEATGKTLILKTVLEESSASFSWISCHECITARQLTERIASTVASEVHPDAAAQKAENVSNLTVFLQSVLKDSNETKHFLVLDRIDRQLEPSPTLIASLKRMGEYIPKLSVVFIISAPNPRQFSSAEIPHVHFTPYTREESIEILSKNPLPIKNINPEESDDEEPTDEDKQEEFYVWQKFCATVWDSLAKGAAKDVVRFRSAVTKNWSAFTQPIARGEYGTRNYASLYLYHKEMFRSENSVIDTVIPLTSAERIVVKSHDLPYYSKFLLIAAYLASYNPARYDIQLFTKGTDGKKKRRGGGSKKPGTRKMQRKLLGAQPFMVERLLAIFPSITPEKVPASIDIQHQIATLTSLRLVVKTTSSDPLDGSAKWKVNVGWEYIRGIARSVKFDIEDYMIE
ncbi:Similar to Origin recognition complex subunit 5; acc. no. O43114 [Pyronema omphalodes CBS 100304]|uniref:Similar to Origin recognition complex subunit 5 acc. no. O43114 n=1 Tax=Pyronema omphalodes (strain CBS 100304) TaxID=1076935 RepID=U4KXG9_PYROM|nr:Similar to Origin recognition complex subunit 5; acc. no. O43114 [Pyronema omphalodes CBS 100304]